MTKTPKKLVLIDGNAIIHRAFHALPPLTNKKGELLNAVYGFTSILLKVMDDIKPDYLIAAFDLKGPTFRHEEYKEYKATRVKAPDELYAQIDRVKEVTQAFNIPIYEMAGFEADDVIGTIATQAENSSEEIESIIVTGDLDMLQLVSPKTTVYALRRGMSDIVTYDEAAVVARYGLTPTQFVDFKGLKGDPSDNIPGVKGIGEKTAITLIQKYNSIEGVYESISELKGALKEKLEKDKMNALMSKRLSAIVLDAPVKLELDKAVLKEFDRQKVVELFQELNFFSLVKRIPGNTDGVHPVKSAEGGPAAQEFNGVKDFKFELISADKLDAFVQLLDEQTEIALHLRFTGGKYYEGQLQGIAICHKTGRAGYVEYSESNFAKLKGVLGNEKIRKIGYDLKTDLEILKNTGIDLRGIDFDVMLAAYVLNPGTKIELPILVLEELGEELEKAKEKGQLALEIESPEEIAVGMCRAADYVFKLKNILAKKIDEISVQQDKEKNLQFVFEKVEMPVAEILAEMEMHGVKLNPIIFAGISETIEKRIASLEKSIYKLAGVEFNINSPKQLASILFENLQLPTGDIKKLKTGYSTAAGELAKLAGQHKIIEKIEEYREIFKLKTTYLDSLPKLVDADSRIHTSYNQAVAATGRLSSSDPNLQNIPIKTDLGQLLRTAFVAEDGYRLVSADYSQIDLRSVAHVSGDKNMIEAFSKGEDIHRATAAVVNGVTLSQVSDAMRSKAKALNFGIIYGMGAFGFSARTGIDRFEAKKFIDAYMERFAGVAKYMADTREFVKQNLFVETEVGRRRYIPEIKSPNFQVQNAAERMAINMPIQGLSADIMKLAMIAAEKLVEKYAGQARMILQVHDELIFEVKEEVAEKFAAEIKTVMENVYKLRVPLVVEVGTGDNWGEI
jgi:DNA polymerase-1